MSLEKTDFLLGLSNECKNPSCGHSSDDHPFSKDYTKRSCNVCECDSFELFVRLTPLAEQLTINLDTVQLENVQLDNVQLEKKIDLLEDAYGKSQKEVERLKKKIKHKDAKNKELRYAVGLLEIELQVSEDVKRNLKHLLDKEE